MMRFFRIVLVSIVAVVATAAALFGFLIYAPAPDDPHLSGKLAAGTIEASGHQRTYLEYVPKALVPGAPLVLVLHGSDGNGARIRIETGYAFERLADKYGFAVVFPDAYDGYWNACNIAGDYSANKLDIDDVQFLTVLAEKVARELGVDPDRVFAAGASRGGAMAYRLALEAPSRFRAVAAISANIPVPENFKCKSAGQGTSSVIIMNGTLDPLVPYNGGEVGLFGVLYLHGRVRSSIDSAMYLSALNSLKLDPQTADEAEGGDGIRVEKQIWSGNGKTEIELVTVVGGGHTIPQPYRRAPRLLGPTAREPNGPALIWDFFQRQHN
jgi:polyhydroxybutyrate depolymerase